MAIDRRHIVTLRGKDFPMWAGVLDAATEAGLKSLVTTIVQIPGPENGHLAVVMARAEFADGRVFEDVGDASPQSTSPALAPAVLRLASTRAKGRVLRDSLNVGETMYEELPDDDEMAGAKHPPGAARNGAPAVHAPQSPARPAPAAGALDAPPAAGGSGPAPECSAPGCGKPLTKGQQEVSRRSYGRPLCPNCQRQATKVG
jgi:hypothetical protein